MTDTATQRPTCLIAMRQIIAVLLAAAVIVSVTTPVRAEPNTRLQQLLQQDGADRMGTRGRPWDPKITQRDAERAAAVREELRAGRLKVTKDFYAAALIMQHGDSPDDFRLANALSWLAYSLADDPEAVPAREAAWLYSATWDRMLISLERKQWYGTQRPRDPVTNMPGEQFPVEEGAATPRDKARFSGPRYGY